MIEAHRHMPRLGQAFVRGPGHLEPCLRGGQSGVVDPALARDQVRHVGIAEHREPLGPHRQRSVERFGQVLGSLAGEAIHQVEVDRADAAGAQTAHGAGDGFCGLDAADGALDARAEGLDAEADAVDAVAGQRLGPVPAEVAGIDLHRMRGAGGGESRAQAGAEAIELCGRHGVGAAATPGDVDHPPAPIQRGGDAVDFRAEAFEIALQPFGAVHRAGVAAAVPADLAAIGHVEVERDRLIRAHVGQRRCHVGWAHVVTEVRRSGEAGVARHRGREQIGVVGPHGLGDAPGLARAP